MKFVDGYMISSGNPVKDYVDYAYRHVMLRQGVLGIKVWVFKGEIVLEILCKVYGFLIYLGAPWAFFSCVFSIF